MDVHFRTKQLANQCNCQRKATRKWGPELAKKLRRRLDDLEAAESLADMLDLFHGRCHELKGNRSGQLSLDLAHPQRLLFEPAHEEIPMKPDGGLDWSGVTKVRILGVEDTHE